MLKKEKVSEHKMAWIKSYGPSINKKVSNESKLSDVHKYATAVLQFCLELDIWVKYMCEKQALFAQFYIGPLFFLPYV